MELARVRTMLRTAEAKAAELGIRVATSVVDAGGNLVAFERMPGTALASLTIAHGKAYTAVAWQRPSVELGPIAQPGAGGYGINTIDSRYVLSDGGVPLKDGETLVGAIGVSGGTGEEDGICARAAAELFTNGEAKS